MKRIPPDFPDRQVCIIGCGYVGLTLAAVMADVGFDVLGVEIRDDVLAGLQRGEPHFHEPGLKGLLGKLVDRGDIRFVKHVPADCPCRVFIVTVGTPLDRTGHSRMDMVSGVSRELARALKPGDMVVMRSTVKLGTTRDVVVPILDSAKVPYDLVFCPERTLEGQALTELRHLPQIVGGAHLGARVRAAQMFNFVTPTVVQVSSLETAEMIKLVDNTSRDVQFAFANEVARMCDASGISAMEVINAGKLAYTRTNLPMPGLVGGPCLEKDPHILAEGMRERGIEPEIAMAARRLNEAQPAQSVAWLRERCGQHPGFPEQPTVTLAGVAFKGRPATDDLRGTMAKPIIAALRAAWPQARIRAWDPVATPAQVSAELGVETTDSLDAAFRGSDLLIIANNHTMFQTMQVDVLARAMNRPGFVYDFWNHFEAGELAMPAGTGYGAVGSHSHSNWADRA